MDYGSRTNHTLVNVNYDKPLKITISYKTCLNVRYVLVTFVDDYKNKESIIFEGRYFITSFDQKTNKITTFRWSVFKTTSKYCNILWIEPTQNYNTLNFTVQFNKLIIMNDKQLQFENGDKYFIKIGMKNNLISQINYYPSKINEIIL
jgi:hypothetical protein